MPVDSAKTPTSVRQRYLVTALLTILLVVVGYMVYVKEIRHSGGGSATPAPVSAQQSPVPSTTSTTLIPGGIPVSTRNPFGA